MEQYNSNPEIQSEMDEFRQEEYDLKKSIVQNHRAKQFERQTEDDPEKTFWGVELAGTSGESYNVEWITERPTKKKRSQKFPNIPFIDCKLSRNLWSVVYNDSLIVKPNWTIQHVSHRETFYSQKKLPWWWLKIPGRHVAEDWTVRDGEWFIVIAADLNRYPRWTQVMTTLWPWKVYDTGEMTKDWFDIYTNW